MRALLRDALTSTRDKTRVLGHFERGRKDADLWISRERERRRA